MQLFLPLHGPGRLRIGVSLELKCRIHGLTSSIRLSLLWMTVRIRSSCARRNRRFTTAVSHSQGSAYSTSGFA